MALENVCTEALKMFSVENLCLGVKVHFPHAITVVAGMTFTALHARLLPSPKAGIGAAGLHAGGGSAVVMQSPCKGQGSIFWKQKQFGGAEIPYESWGFFVLSFYLIIG